MIERGLPRLCLGVLLLQCVLGAQAMVFRSDQFGAHWDTWCFEHEGTFHTYYLITEYGYGEGVGLITSTNGVHWKDHGEVIHQSDRNTFYLGSGAVWKTVDFENSGRFIMNYSEHRTDAAGKQMQNILFAWSTNLMDWVKYPADTMFQVDDRYYDPHGRWDCIFAFPREEGGYWGTWSATGKAVKGTVGIGYSEDGLSWTALPPPTVEVGANEAGAFYPINNQVHGMFIARPDRGIWSYYADRIHGPYKRSPKNAHLTQRGPTAFARFFPTDDGLLANHYQWSGTKLPRKPESVGRDREITYIATFKRIVVDEEGILRWKYWEGNEAIKGRPMPLENGLGEYDLDRGLVLEADVALPSDGGPPVTLVLNAAGKNYEVRMLTGGRLELEALQSSAKGWQKKMRVDREWPFIGTAKLRLLVRAGMIEVYLDDHFMECWTMMGCYGADMVKLTIEDPNLLAAVKVWQMSLPPCEASLPEQPLKAVATASSLHDARFPAAHAVDGNPSTRWCSAQPYGPREWIQIDMGTNEPIGRVEILWETAFAQAFQLSVSEDGETWAAVHRTSAGDGGRDVLNGLKTSGRFLRLDCLERGTRHGYSIREIQVFSEVAPADTEDVVPADFSYEPVFEPSRRRSLRIDKRYLNIPLLRGEVEVQRRLSIWIDDRLLGGFSAPLVPSKPEFHGFIDLSPHLGRTLTLEVDRFPCPLDGFTLDNHIKGGEDMYDELYRPQFHFTSKRGWLNDPNGLIYHKGEYHLYYQYNPLGTVWGNMSWGHAVSSNLVHWREEPAVLYPNPETGACYSGAAFVDRWNQLGKKAGEEDVLVAFYLRTKIGLSLAWSNDRGRTFTDYEGNPVLTHAGARIDTPRPFWFEPTKRWIAPTYDFFTNDRGERLRCVGIYSSTNLVNWEYESRVEQDKWGDELCGCVDFFQLPLDGNANNRQWVMIFIEGSYIVGDFDGHVFRTLDGRPASTRDRITSLVRPGNYYATMTWENAPDDRRVQVTWMKGPAHPDMPFNQQMTAPSELTLHSTPEGPRLRMNPIRELESLRTRSHEWSDLVLQPGENPLAALSGDLQDLEVEFIPSLGSKTVFRLRGTEVVYEADTHRLTCVAAGTAKTVTTTLEPVDGVIRLRMLLDRASLEVYGNDGRLYVPLIAFPEPGNRTLIATCDAGEVGVRWMRLHELRSAWLD